MFSLIEQEWIPARRRDGTRTLIAPWQLTNNADNPIVDIEAPRPDFRGASYQFLIGLVQSTHAPPDERAWLKQFRVPPLSESLHASFSQVAAWFDLEDAKAPFMQEPGLAKDEKAEREPITGLLIEAPGEKTMKDNTDFFTRRVPAAQYCGGCAASAVYTLQVNSPAGGRGTMTSIRGGGPLTTLVRGSTLWETVWLSVVPRDLWLDVGDGDDDAGRRFPWARPPPKKREMRLAQIHPDHHYWATPRRLLLDAPAQGICSLCGRADERTYAAVRALAGGFQYAGEFRHPLTPTRKLKEDRLTAKGQPSPAAYRNFVGLVESRLDKTAQPALIVKHFRAERQERIAARAAPLWAFGYSVDNAKVEGWYEGSMPILSVEPAHAEAFARHVEMLVDAASLAASLLRGAIKDTRLGELRGDLQPFSDPFWAATEAPFYQNLDKASAALQAQQLAEPLRAAWRLTIEREALSRFDQATRRRSTGDGDPKRLHGARKKLKMNLRGKRMCETILGLPKIAKEAPA